MHELPQRHTPSLPESTTKVVFAKDCLRAATSAAQRAGRLRSKRIARRKELPARCMRRARRDVNDFLTDTKSRLLDRKSCKFHFESGQHC